MQFAKARLLYSILLIGMMLLVLLVFQAPALAESKTVNVGVYQNEPLIFTEDSNPQGIYISVLEEVARQQDWKLKYVKSDWNTVFRQLKRGKIDILPVVAYTEARLDQMDFSEETLLTNWGQVFTRSDLDVDSIQDLQGRKIALQPQDTHAQYFSNLLEKLNIPFSRVSIKKYKGIFEALDEGEVGAGVVNRLFAKTNAPKYTVQSTPIVFNPIQIRYAVPPGDPKNVLPALNRLIPDLKEEQDSAYNRALEKWFGVQDPSIRYPEWLFKFLAGLGVLLAIGWFAVVWLRVQVNRKTREIRRVNANLSESEHKYRRVIETAMDGFLLVDTNGGIIEVNPAYTKMSGYKADDLVGTRLDRMATWSDRTRIWNYIERVILSGSERFEALNQRKNGSIFHVDVCFSYDSEDEGMIAVFVRDVSERKQIEESLRQSENYYRAIFETSGTAMCIFEEDTTISLVNSNFLALSGYSQEELEGKKSWTELIHFDDVGWLLKKYHLYRQDPDSAPLQYEFRILTRYGEERNILASVDMIPGSNRSITSGIDITERKRMEQSLRRERDLSQRYLDTTQTMMVALDEEGRITMINRSGCALLGYAENEILGCNWFETFLPHPEGMDSVYPVFRSIMVDDLPSVEYFENNIVCRDGTQRLMGWHNAILKDDEGKVVGILASGEDITESRRSEEALRESEQQYRNLFENMRDAILLADTERRIFDCNPAFETLFGYSLKEIKGKKTSYVYENEEEFQSLGNAIRANNNDSSFLMTVHFKKKNGEVFPGETGAFYLKDQNDNITGFIGVIRDVTFRKQAEERLQNAHDKLDKLVQLNADGLMVLDREGCIRFLNPAATRMLGSEKEELVGEQFGYPLLPASSTEIELLSGSGEVNVVELRATETKWDGQTSLLASLRDITDRKQAEEEVSHLNRVLRSVRSVNQLITVEKDKNRLIQGVCDKLVEERGYDNAWIALLSESGEFTAFAEAGLERVLNMPAEKCLQSALPYCGRKALEQSDLVLVQDPGATCTGCPLSGDHESRTGIAVPLKHKRTVYGVLSLSLPDHFGFQEEQDLVREVGDDIGYALYGIELEEKRRQHESEQGIILRLLHELHQFHSVPELISDVTSMLKEWSGCEAIGIRLQQGDDYPYYVTRGFPEKHIRLENKLCEVDARGEVIRDFQGNPVLECMCGNVLKGCFDSSLPFFTEKGSFWTNSTTDLLASSSEEDRQARTRNRCQGEGYESVALIPLRHGDQTLGLLQFNDPRRDQFTKHFIHLLERIAENLALGLVQRQTKDGLREREHLFRQLFEQAPVGIIIATADLTIEESNQTALSILGYSREEILHLSAWDIIHPDDFRSDSSESTLQSMFSDDPVDWEKKVRTRQGSSIHALVNMANLPYYSAKASHMIMFQDISERKQAEERIYNLAYYDEITGLPNRRLFHDRLKQVAAQSENFGDGGIVFLVDITRLREVNDTLGQQAGDELIQEVGRRLRDTVLEEDTVARISGGEFMLLSEGLETDDRARNLGVHILEGIGQKLGLSGRLIYPQVKIGFTLFPQRGTDPDTLIKQARMALSEAKKGAHNIQEFAWQEDWISKQFHLEHDLKQALGNEEFFLCYQSQIDLRSGRIVGLEALLRWDHPERGVVSPGEFIPVLEHTGMIASADEWVIHRVCKQLKTWQDSGIFVKTSVNLSAQELSNDATLDIVWAALEENGVRAENLEVEITETSLMENVDRASWVLQTLSCRGVKSPWMISGKAIPV